MFIWTFFDHKDLGNHLLQLCPKVVKHSVYLSQHFPFGAAFVCQAGNFWTLLRIFLNRINALVFVAPCSVEVRTYYTTWCMWLREIWRITVLKQFVCEVSTTYNDVIVSRGPSLGFGWRWFNVISLILCQSCWSVFPFLLFSIFHCCVMLCVNLLTPSGFFTYHQV